MNNIKRSVLSAAVITALGLSACGGGGDTTANNNNQTSGTVQGVITGFGSVYVNGVEYETTEASITIDGQPASESDLQVGMVVTLEGSDNGATGNALNIEFNDELEGIVQANNVNADGSLTVMGQTVNTSADTIFESDDATITTLDAIPVDAVVEVSGYGDGSGVIYATRIELKNSSWAGEEIEVKGVISGTDTATMTFALGGVSVDYSAAQLEGLTEPSDGLYVEVKSTDGFVGGNLVASKVELEGDGDRDLDGEAGEKVDLEGVLTVVATDLSSVSVNGQNVLLTSGTEYEHGTSADLAEGVTVSVDAYFNDAGVLVAEEIAFGMEGELELQGAIEAISDSAITVMGQSITVNSQTIMLDESTQTVRYFDLADLAVGDSVEVNAYRDETTQGLVATKLERDDGDDSMAASLEGPVEAIGGSNLTILGITVDISSVSGFSAAVGDVVKVEGQYDAGTMVLTATSAEIDD